MAAHRPEPAHLEPLFRQKVFNLLKAHGLPDRVDFGAGIIDGEKFRSVVKAEDHDVTLSHVL